MITKKYTIDFNSSGGALTLNTEEVKDILLWDKTYMKTHKDGWTIIGTVYEDYYEWVNEFVAFHPIFGKVWGDFEDIIFADSNDGFEDFYKRHQPEAWDYGDI